MKFLKKLVVLLILTIIFAKNLCVMANVIDIGDISKIQRGDLGFYTIQYWDKTRNEWMYVTYSRTFYKDKTGQNRLAYCVDPDLDGVGWLPGEVNEYNATIDKKLDNVQLWKVYKNGYPNKAPNELGVETEDDAYLATKQAGYFVIRQRPLSEVHKYFRAGQIEINGENLTDIQRRGEKVINAIYKLVEIAYNTTDSANEAPISVIENFKQDTNPQYYSQMCKVANTNTKTTYTISGIKNTPQGTFISDTQGNVKTTLNSGDMFKIMVPKANIDNNYSMEIPYVETIQNYPVYYAKSENSGMQNYVVIADKEEVINSKFVTSIVGYKSNLTIAKVDSETNKAIPGVKFEVDYADTGIVLGKYTTNQNGEIVLTKLLQGKLAIKEIATDSNYIIEKEPTIVNVDYDSSYKISIKNSHKKGELEINKFAQGTKEKLQGVEFDLIDENGNVTVHLVTDINGYAKIENINTGKYILKETKAKEGYKIIEDKEIEIKWNEKLTLNLENEKEKGNLELIKLDKDDNNIALEGVKIKILDFNKKEIGEYTTNSLGIIELNNLDLGKYFIKEVETKSGYVLNAEIIPIEIRANELTKLKLENEKEKGTIKIFKISDEDSLITHIKKDEPIKGVKFEIYDERNNLIESLISDESGVCTTSKLVKGKYIIKEVEPAEWYLQNKENYIAEIKENGEEIGVTIKNIPEIPKLDIKKYAPEKIKIDKEIEYSFEIKNIGNVPLSEFMWYDFLPYQYSRITKISTGTYNKDITYDICYRTNKKAGYILLEKSLSSIKNNYIDLTKIALEEGEIITDIKINFGTAEVGFESIEKPLIYVKLNNNLYNNQEILNETILEGYNKTYKLSDSDFAKTIIEVDDKLETKKLPRTGF